MSENPRSESDRSRTPRKPKGGEERLWHYALSAFALLVVLTAAILTPNYLNYCFRVRQLEHISSSTNAVRPTTPPIAASSNQPPTTSVVSARPEPDPLGEPPLKPADIYETYGQLITMLLGFVAAVGVLCGYFAKKSVRELTEDVRDDMDREKEWFRRECDLALKEANAAKTDAKESLDEAKKLEASLSELVKKTHDGLKALDEAIAKYKDNGSSQASSTTKTTATVDEQLRKELP